MESIEVQAAELSCNNGVENFDAILGSFGETLFWLTIENLGGIKLSQKEQMPLVTYSLLAIAV